jgi:hypothetical protein
MLCIVVRPVWDERVGKSRFSVDPNIYVQRSLVNNYV